MSRATTHNRRIEELEQQLDLLQQQQERHRRALEILYNISVACRRAAGFEELFMAVHRELRAVFDFDAGFIALSESANAGVFYAALLFDDGELKYKENDLYGPITQLMVERREPLLFHDLVVERAALGMPPPSTFGQHDKLSRSWLGVPLLLGNDAIGVISIQSYMPGRYDQEDRSLLQEVGNLVAVALENAKLSHQQRTLSGALQAQVRTRTRELTALSTLAAELVLQRPLPDLLHQSLMLIVPLMDVSGGSVRLLDHTGQALLLMAQRGYPEDYLQRNTRLPVDGSLQGRVVRENVPQIVPHGLRQQGILGTVLPFESLLSVPLRIGERVLGTFNLVDVDERHYDQQQVDLVQAIANQLAIAVENARLFETQERQIAELQSLARIGQAASTALEPLTLLRQVHAAMRDFIHLDAFTMALYDPERKLITDGIALDEGDEYHYLHNQPLPPGSLTSWVVEHRQPLHVRNLQLELARSNELQLHVAGKAPSSWLGVPLLDRAGEPIGVISLQGEQPNTFTERDELFLVNVARQVALHVQNVRLLGQRERQIKELDAIGEIGRLVSASFDLEEMLRDIQGIMTRITGAPVFYISVYSPERNILTKAFFVEEGERINRDWEGNPPRSGSLTEWILRHRQPLLFEDMVYQQAPGQGITPISFGGQRRVRSWVGVPLLAKDGEAIGLLSLQDYEPHAYDLQTIDFLNKVASHISLAVQKVRLFQEIERQLHERDVLNRISQAANSTLDLSTVLERLHYGLGEIMDVNTSFIGLYGSKSNTFSYPLVFDRGERIYFDQLQLGENNLNAWVIRNKQPLLLSSAEEADQYRGHTGNAIRIGAEDALEQSYVIVPIIAGEEVLGVINIQSYQRNAFSQQDLHFVMMAAGHAAAAINNARLFQAAQEHAAAAERHAHKMELLHRISSVLSSKLNQQEILELAASELVRLFWADHTGIALFDEEKDIMTVVAEYPRGTALGLTLPLRNNPINDEMIVTRRPVCIESLATDPRTAAVRGRLSELGVVSMMIVPLVIRDRVIGSIGLDSYHTPRIFSDEEQELFLTVATSIAAAIENARLFAAEQAARQTADTLREIARVLSTSFDPNEVLQLILRELQQVVPYDTASIALVVGNQLRMAAGQGWDDPSVLKGVTFPLDRPSGAGLVLHRREPILLSDVTTFPDWMPLDVASHVRCWMGIPLIVKGELLGVLSIESRKPNCFGRLDVEAAVAFANHAALALENARLYQESVTRVEQELAIARQIQSNLFPRTLPQLPGITVAATCVPARETGGDFFDFVELGEQRMGIMIGDASGKSIPAAMLMAIARSIARSEARDHETPQAVMRETNRWVAHDVPPNSFVALCYATVDLRRRQLALSNAGQLTPLLRRADGRLLELEVPGPRLPLGIVPTMHYSALHYNLAPGDLLLFFTDGIVEAHNPDRELFGFDRVISLLQEHGALPPEQLIERIMEAISVFMGRAPQHDDMTVVAIRVD